MDVVAEVTFRSWLAESGIVQDPKWATTDWPCFLDAKGSTRFWFPSFVPSDLPGFIGTALTALSSHGPYYLLRRGGGDWYDAPPGPLSNLMINDILGVSRVPTGSAGALRFPEAEWKDLTAIILAFYVHGWSVGEDLYIFAEERDGVLMISHHGELDGRFPSDARMERFRAAMLEEGYDLPSELPDETFKAPAWLKGRVRRGTA